MPSTSPRAAVTRRLSRAAVAVATAAVTIAAFSTPAAAAEADGGAAAGWLAAQADGPHFGEPGATADAIVAFVAADAASGATKTAIAWLDDAAVVEPYIGTGAERSSSKIAKLLLAAAASGNGSTLGGIDLEAELRKLEGSDGVFTGGFTSVLGQSLAILSLQRTGDGVSDKAVDALVDWQCDDGSYGFTPDGCDAPDPDATGYAASALLAVGGGSDAEQALEWLASQQKDSGGFVAGYPGAPENANSTAMAAQALASGGYDTEVAKAREFLGTLQNGCDAAEADRGGIAYDASGFDPDMAAMATMQAIPALTGEGLVELDATDDKTEVPVLDCDGAGNGDGDGDGDGNSDGNGDGTGDDTAGKLPVTGSSLTLPIVVAAAAALTGAGLLFVSRRSKAVGRSS